MLDLRKCPQPHPDVASITIDGETVVVLEDGQVEVLNQLGTRVWALSDGHRSRGEIVEAVAAEYHMAREQVAADVEVFVQGLLQDRALVLTDHRASEQSTRR